MKKLLIGLLIYAVLFLTAQHVFALGVPTAPLTVVRDYTMQPFGIGYEDADTAELHVQNTYNPQVMQNGVFLQGSK